MRSPLDGPPPALPGPLDRVAERWARTAPRVRIALVVTALAVAGVVQADRLADAQAQWGGQGAQVWRARQTVAAGQEVRPHLEAVRLPRAAIPATAVTGRVAPGTVLALPLVEGGLLTDVHLSPGGPTAGIAADERLVPIPVEATWGIEAGSIVDVWAVLGDAAPPEPLAIARPVLEVREEGGRLVALVSLHEDDVGAATASISRGRVLLTSRGG